MDNTIQNLTSLSIEAHENPSLLELHTGHGVMHKLTELYEEYAEISKGAVSISDFELSDSTNEKCHELKKAINRYNNLYFLKANIGNQVEIKSNENDNEEPVNGIFTSFTSKPNDSFSVNIQTNNATLCFAFPLYSIIHKPSKVNIN
jgi:hypothetical protein